MSYYASVEYWNNRYTNNFKSFEWYQTCDSLFPILQEHIPQTISEAPAKILVVGCGTSHVPKKLLEAGYTAITAVDFSSVLIEKLKLQREQEKEQEQEQQLLLQQQQLQAQQQQAQKQQKQKQQPEKQQQLEKQPEKIVEKPEKSEETESSEEQEKVEEPEKLIYEEADATNLSNYEDASFDAVIDKATLDAILCCDQNFLRSNSFISSVYRVLRRDGVFIEVSKGNPEKRSHLFSNSEHTWTVTDSTLPRAAQAEESEPIAGLEGKEDADDTGRESASSPMEGKDTGEEEEANEEEEEEDN